jgi:hypothetical protein
VPEHSAFQNRTQLDQQSIFRRQGQARHHWWHTSPCRTSRIQLDDAPVIDNRRLLSHPISVLEHAFRHSAFLNRLSLNNTRKLGFYGFADPKEFLSSFRQILSKMRGWLMFPLESGFTEGLSSVSFGVVGNTANAKLGTPMSANNINLMDVMAVKRDAARKARKAAADKARRAAKKAAERASDQTKATVKLPLRGANAQKTPTKAKMAVPSESRKTLCKMVVGIRTGAVSKARATVDALGAAITAEAGPVKVTVKQAVLDVFYSGEQKILSTDEVVAAIQAAHPGMNESSIRVWISDFRKDGSIKLVKKVGRKAILKTGKLGKFALR